MQQEANRPEEQATQPQEKFNIYAAARLAVLRKHMDQEGSKLADPAHNLATNFSNLLKSMDWPSLSRSVHAFGTFWPSCPQLYS